MVSIMAINLVVHVFKSGKKVFKAYGPCSVLKILIKAKKKHIFCQSQVQQLKRILKKELDLYSDWKGFNTPPLFSQDGLMGYRGNGGIIHGGT